MRTPTSRLSAASAPSPGSPAGKVGHFRFLRTLAGGLAAAPVHVGEKLARSASAGVHLAQHSDHPGIRCHPFPEICSYPAVEGSQCLDIDIQRGSQFREPVRRSPVPLDVAQEGSGYACPGGELAEGHPLPLADESDGLAQCLHMGRELGIATEERRRLDIVWEAAETDDYDRIAVRAKKLDQDMRVLIKGIIRAAIRPKG